MELTILMDRSLFHGSHPFQGTIHQLAAPIVWGLTSITAHHNITLLTRVTQILRGRVFFMGPIYDQAYTHRWHKSHNF